VDEARAMERQLPAPITEAAHIGFVPPDLVLILPRVELGVAELTEHDHLVQRDMVVNVRACQTPGGRSHASE